MTLSGLILDFRVFCMYINTTGTGATKNQDFGLVRYRIWNDSGEFWADSDWIPLGYASAAIVAANGDALTGSKAVHAPKLKGPVRRQRSPPIAPDELLWPRGHERCPGKRPGTTPPGIPQRIPHQIPLGNPLGVCLGGVPGGFPWGIPWMVPGGAHGGGSPRRYEPGESPWRILRVQGIF